MKDRLDIGYMLNIKEKISRLISRLGFGKRRLLSTVVFFVIVSLVFVGVTFYTQYFSNALFVILAIELGLIVMVTWTMAGYAVMKSLVYVSAGLSLLIFLAQSYCDVPTIARTGNDALKILLGFGLLYITLEFFRSLYKEMSNHSKFLKDRNEGKKPWMILVPFALFTGIFIWQVYQVVSPIIHNLCVFS